MVPAEIIAALVLYLGARELRGGLGRIRSSDTVFRNNPVFRDLVAIGRCEATFGVVQGTCLPEASYSDGNACNSVEGRDEPCDG